MTHFLYLMDPDVKAPAGSVSTEEWFKHYKWHIDDHDIYFPVPNEDPLQDKIQVGDGLWFAFKRGEECTLKGLVEVIGVSDDALNGRREVHYDGTRCAYAGDFPFTQPGGYSPLVFGLNIIDRVVITVGGSGVPAPSST